MSKVTPKPSDTGLADHAGMIRLFMRLFHLETAALSAQGDIFLHHDLGRMWPPLGVKLLLICNPGIWLCFYGLFLREDLPDAFWNFAPLWPLCYANIALVVIHSVTAARREVGLVDTIYDGLPWLWHAFPELGETQVKRLEIKLLFVLSALVCFVTVPLGTYMLAVAFSSAFQMDLENWRADRDAEGMADGEHRAAVLMDRMKT